MWPISAFSLSVVLFVCLPKPHCLDYFSFIVSIAVRDIFIY